MTFRELLNENTRFVITYNGKKLAGYYFNGFSGGMKESFKFSNQDALLYKSEKEAKDKILEIQKDLKDWIEKDIPEQAKKWSDKDKQEFLDESKKLYEKILKNVKKFKIKQS